MSSPFPLRIGLEEHAYIEDDISPSSDSGSPLTWGLDKKVIHDDDRRVLTLMQTKDEADTEYVLLGVESKWLSDMVGNHSPRRERNDWRKKFSDVFEKMYAYTVMYQAGHEIRFFANKRKELQLLVDEAVEEYKHTRECKGCKLVMTYNFDADMLKNFVKTGKTVIHIGDISRRTVEKDDKYYDRADYYFKCHMLYLSPHSNVGFVKGSVKKHVVRRMDGCYYSFEVVQRKGMCEEIREETGIMPRWDTLEGLGKTFGRYRATYRLWVDKSEVETAILEKNTRFEGELYCAQFVPISLLQTLGYGYKSVGGRGAFAFDSHDSFLNRSLEKYGELFKRCFNQASKSAIIDHYCGGKK